MRAPQPRTRPSVWWRCGFCLSLTLLAANTATALTLGWWNFEGDGTPITEINGTLELKVAQRFENFQDLVGDWPQGAIAPGEGVNGSSAAVLFGDDAILGVTIRNIHESEDFQIEEIRFSVRSIEPLGLLFRFPGRPFFEELDDGIFVDGPEISEVIFDLAAIGSDVILPPGESVSVGIAVFGGPSPSHIDDIIIVGTGPSNPPRPPDNEIQPITSIERTAGGNHVSMPLIFGRRVGIQFSTDMSEGSWISLGNFFEEGEQMVFTDPDPTRRDAPTIYYRAFLRPLDP